jgi:predicted TIM-barrel fold metal-dependent hydrolase
MLDVVDFHGHWFPPTVVDTAVSSAHTPAMRAAWPLLTDIERQLAAVDVALKVVCAPLASLRAAAIVAPDELAPRTNDAYAEAIARYPGRLTALATVDAYAGDAGAEEARRAVDELGLPGLLVEAADGEQLLGDPVARPTLDFAAERGLTVFAHPVNPPAFGARFTRTPGGILLARGTESALSTLALLTQGIPAGLRLVIAGIGAAAIAHLAFLEGEFDLTALHVDTMGFDPHVTRYLVDRLGAGNVVVGSDWPIMRAEASAERVAAMLAGFDPETATAIAGGNARRLLGV